MLPHKCTILVVDDEVSIQNSLKRILRSEPYSVLTASSGQEGIDIFRKHSIQVVISDFKMPGMNGVSFLSAIREINADCVRIILSGYADSKAVEDGLNAGDINYFINKPWQDEELKNTIRNSFDYIRVTNSQ